jgi:tRNA pseudouridine38-40 synthase
VQQIIENSLSQILKIPIAIIGCGRTDAQVHASQFFFHVDIEREWDFDLLFRLNKLLPSDIAVFDIIPMEGLPHARFDATKRSYDYFIHTYKDPFLSGVSSLYLERNLDLMKMKEATALLTKYNDYAAFCKGSAGYEHTICHVSAAQLFADASGDKLRFQISSNRFLAKMIRIIIGKLIDIGKGELTVDAFEYNLASKEIPKTIEPAYPQGLFLSKITYPYLDLAPRTAFSSILQNKVDLTWQAV